MNGALQRILETWIFKRPIDFGQEQRGEAMVVHRRSLNADIAIALLATEDVAHALADLLGVFAAGWGVSRRQKGDARESRARDGVLLANEALPALLAGQIIETLFQGGFEFLGDLDEARLLGADGRRQASDRQADES